MNLKLNWITSYLDLLKYFSILKISKGLHFPELNCL